MVFQNHGQGHGRSFPAHPTGRAVQVSLYTEGAPVTSCVSPCFSLDLLQRKTSARTTRVAEASVSSRRVPPTTAAPANTLTQGQTAPEVGGGAPFSAGLPLP